LEHSDEYGDTELEDTIWPLYAAVEEEIGYCHHHGKLRLDLEWLAHSSTSTQLVNRGGAREEPTGQTPSTMKPQSLVDVMPGVGGPSYEQPCPTTAPWSIKIAYDPFILNAALGVAKCSTVRLLSIMTY